MANQNSNSNNSLARTTKGQVQKSSSHSIAKVATKIIRVEESVKTAWSNECNKTSILRAEFEVWDEL